MFSQLYWEKVTGFELGKNKRHYSNFLLTQPLALGLVQEPGFIRNPVFPSSPLSPALFAPGRRGMEFKLSLIHISEPTRPKR